MKITEEQHLEKDWYKEAKEQTLETLPKFINHLMNDYEHDYGTVCKAISACMLATMSACDKEPQGGITGFQASCIMWELIPKMTLMDMSAGATILTYSDMLYPQYKEKFDKTISRSCFKRLQRLAKKHLKDIKHPIVKAHMQSIVNGVIPFGYKIKDN